MRYSNSNDVGEEPILHHLFKIGRGDDEVYLPQIINTEALGGGQALKDQLSSFPFIAVHDEIHGQLQELVKLRNPEKQKFSPDEVESLIKIHLNDIAEVDYGVWLYYPWSARLVHILPEEEFIEVRTNRNRNKITKEESEILSKKKVGIIGLSVGQSVSVTMAMERSFGEIRLADFDKLELTNLNRIRTGLFNLGLPKVISVAREIMEIDPFLKLSIYPEGINEENILDFLTGGGKLDALIDECDGLDIKILCRIKAKELCIPVLMEASDRGTIDVERFDLEPRRPILHGFVDHLDLSKIKDLKTNEEKIPYLLPIAGMETLSEKMRASMLEIGQSLTTWPQLSSAVTLGGGITADTYRRMMLGEFKASGRFFVDLDELLPEASEKGSTTTASFEKPPALEIGEMKLLVEQIQLNGRDRAAMSPELARELVASAILAPSAGNNQPWKWLFKDNALFLFHDRARSVSFSDFGDMGSMIAFGACIENASLIAKQKGYVLNADMFPMKDNAQLICRLTLYPSSDALSETDEALIGSIGKRHTNRHKFSAGDLSKDELLNLASIIDAYDGVRLETLTDRAEVKLIARIVSACERIRIMHPMGHSDFYKDEVRWSDEESRTKGDGIDIATVQLNASELAGMKLASDPSVIEHLRRWKGGRGFEKLSREAVENSPVIGLVQIKGNSKTDLIRGGRMLQRIWLKATEQGIAVHPVSASLFMFSRMLEGHGEGLESDEIKELSALRENYNVVFPSKEGWKDLFMFRMFKSEEEVVRSYRLPLKDVFFKG